MTSHKKKGRRHRKCGYTSKFSEGDIVGVSSQNLKNHWKYFVQKENSNHHARPIALCITYFNSRELSFRDQTLPLASYDIIILKKTRENKLFLIICKESILRGD